MTGDENIALGYDALGSNISGSGNIAIGYVAGLDGTTISNNTYIGTRSGQNVTTGDGCIFIGYYSGYTQADNSNLLIIDNRARAAIGAAGEEATNSILYGVMAAAPADQTLAINAHTTTLSVNGAYIFAPATGNYGLGSSDLYEDLSTGVYNYCLGYQAGVNIADGNYNINLGYQAGITNISGGYNICIGTQAGNDQTASNSVGIGYRALYTVVGGGQNTAVGTYALRGHGASAFTHAYNVGIGYDAGYSIDDAERCIFLGAYAGYHQTSTDAIFIVDDRFRASAVVEATDAILYGEMANAPADQTLRINADVGINVTPSGDYALEVPAYARHIQLPAILAGNAANKPTEVAFDTVGGLQYASTLIRYTYVQWEIPDDWDGTDIIFEVDWFPDSGATSGTDTVKWDVEYRAIAEGEATNQGTIKKVSVTDSGDYAQYVTEHSQHVMPFNDGDQPLTKQDHLFFRISRDTAVANDFGGTVTVPAWEIIYNSVSIPTN